MLDLHSHQGTSLHCHTPEIELRLTAVVSQGADGRTLETLWQVCSHLQRLGYPVIVLDGTAEESYEAPGLQHLLANAPRGDGSFAMGGAHASSLAVLPAFQGLYTLAFNSPHAAQPLQALQPLFRQYALIVVYASVATFSTPLLKGIATTPLLLMQPGKPGIVTSYKQLKQLAIHTGLAGTVACIADSDAPARRREIDTELDTLRQCAARHLGQHIGTTSIYAGSAQDMQRLALRLLENAGTIGVPAHGVPVHLAAASARSPTESYPPFHQRH
ncbi:hypothetical protein [Simplicispira psychrophila]|uniref:hypothetical protein n=1 Tax=Simplicispira psychrophila TaxID=80882 RepID=UPI0004838364|nr:hypothetical protein [Simplicispira psychrophila]